MLLDGMDAVGRLHGNFYNSNLTELAITQHTEDTETFITSLFNLPETSATSPSCRRRPIARIATPPDPAVPGTRR